MRVLDPETWNFEPKALDIMVFGTLSARILLLVALSAAGPIHTCRRWHALLEYAVIHLPIPKAADEKSHVSR